jgi:hypothetical protein
MAVITVPISLQNSYAITYVPLNGQLNITKSGASAIMDPTLYQASVTKTILNVAFNNRMIVTTGAMPNTALATKAMGNDFNREFWF